MMTSFYKGNIYQGLQVTIWIKKFDLKESIIKNNSVEELFVEEFLENTLP